MQHSWHWGQPLHQHGASNTTAKSDWGKPQNLTTSQFPHLWNDRMGNDISPSKLIRLTFCFISLVLLFPGCSIFPCTVVWPSDWSLKQGEVSKADKMIGAKWEWVNKLIYIMMTYFCLAPLESWKQDLNTIVSKKGKLVAFCQSGIREVSVLFLMALWILNNHSKAL